MKRQRYEIGSIIAIPLTDDQYSFAKVYRDYELGIYDLVANKIAPVDQVTKHEIAFFVAGTDAPIRSGLWPVIGCDPFTDEKLEWAPAKAMGVVPGMRINPGLLQISERGVLRRATIDQVRGLDIASFAQRPDLVVQVIIDRLINRNDDGYRVKV